MADLSPSPLSPRKKPVQARSTDTVAAIHEGAIQVLLAGGFQRLTTTRVAERAGVSVGTLYQYYPNKHALTAALLRAHLDGIAAAVEQACVEKQGARLRPLVVHVVRRFLAAKLARIEVSMALYTPMSDLDGAALVRAAGMRAGAALARALSAAPDARLADPARAAGVIVTAQAALVQAALEAGPGRILPDRLEEDLVALALGYLHAARSPG